MVGASLRGIPAALETSQSRFDAARQQDTHLELSQAETTAGADAAVVLEGRAADNGAELVDGAGSDGSGLSSASVAASLLLAGLGLIFVRNTVADRRRLCSHEERGITWSKCTRTRRCQSLRKWLCGICWLCLMAWLYVSLSVFSSLPLSGRWIDFWLVAVLGGHQGDSVSCESFIGTVPFSTRSLQTESTLRKMGVA